MNFQFPLNEHQKTFLKSIDAAVFDKVNMVNTKTGWGFSTLIAIVAKPNDLIICCKY